MSYVLHVWEAPAAATFPEAEAFVWNEARKGEPSTRFVPFVAALHGALPDEWLEPGLDGETSEPIYAFGVSSSGVAGGAVELIAHVAAEHGLHLYDMQGGYLVRPDATMVLHDGTAIPLGDRPGEDDDEEDDEGLTEDDIELRIVASFARSFASDGWKVLPRAGRTKTLSRVRGAVVQQLGFGVNAAGGEARVNLYLSLSSPLVPEALRKLLPADTARIDAVFAADDCDLYPSLNNLGDPFGGYGKWLASVAEIDAWIDQFLTWFRTNARPRLDACSDLAALNRLAHAPRERERQSGASLREMLSTLWLVHLHDDPEVPIGPWVGRVRNFQDGQFKYVRERYAQVPGEYKSIPEAVTDSAIVDRLIERLGQRATHPPAA